MCESVTINNGFIPKDFRYWHWGPKYKISTNEHLRKWQIQSQCYWLLFHLTYFYDHFLTSLSIPFFFKGSHIFFFYFCSDFIYLSPDGEGREKEKERNITVWLPLVRPPLGSHRQPQACAPTGNRTSDPLVLRPELNPLIHTSWGSILLKYYF